MQVLKFERHRGRCCDAVLLFLRASSDMSNKRLRTSVAPRLFLLAVLVGTRATVGFSGEAEDWKAYDARVAALVDSTAADLKVKVALCQKLQRSAKGTEEKKRLAIETGTAQAELDKLSFNLPLAPMPATLEVGDIGTAGPLLISAINGDKVVATGTWGTKNEKKSVVVTGFDLSGWKPQRTVQLDGLLKVIGNSTQKTADGKYGQFPLLQPISRSSENDSTAAKATAKIISVPAPVPLAVAKSDEDEKPASREGYVWVNGHTRRNKNGTTSYVKGYWRKK